MKFSLKKLNKMKYNINPILYNRVILYFISFLAVVDIVYFISTNDFFSLLIFVLLGILTTFFSKNMIVILVISLSITHVVKYGNAAYEGFTEGGEDEDTSGNEEDKKDKKKSTDTPSSSPSTPSSTTSSTPSSTTSSTPSSPSKDIITPTTSSKDMSKSSDKDFDELKKGQKDFENIGKDIMENVKKIEPLLDKAEAFINKYENYKNQQGFKSK